MTLAKDDITQHISGQFNEDLQRLHNDVLTMGQLVGAQIADAVHALETSDAELAACVVNRDAQVNALELRIDEECSRILVRRQPAAGDLRLIFAVIKTVTDLERIGDQAEHVARTVLESGEFAREHRPHLPFLHMGALVQGLFLKAMDAFARLDVAKALEVEQEDLAVDEEHKASMRQLLNYMIADPRTIGSALQLAWAARALERIGDHSKNIAEYVIYMVQGKDVRHISSSERQRHALGTDAGRD